MGLITAAVERLEAKSIAAAAIFRCIQGKFELTDEEFRYHMNRFKDLEINRAFGHCPQPWACKEYRACRELACKREKI